MVCRLLLRRIQYNLADEPHDRALEWDFYCAVDEGVQLHAFFCHDKLEARNAVVV